MTQPHDAVETAAASAPEAAIRSQARRSRAHERYIPLRRRRGVRFIPETPCLHPAALHGRCLVWGYAVGEGADHTNIQPTVAGVAFGRQGRSCSQERGT